VFFSPMHLAARGDLRRWEEYEQGIVEYLSQT
jgi:hypothetical protein